MAVVTEADQPDLDSTSGPISGEDDEDQVSITPVPAILEGEIWLDADGSYRVDVDFGYEPVVEETTTVVTVEPAEPTPSQGSLPCTGA